MIVDLRSDTLTRPTPEMLKAMCSATVGDDVFGEDPTVNRLESLAASIFGMEAALFCASGTMSNQISVKIHTQPGDEVICHVDSHVYQYEAGGIAFNSGCQVKLLEGERGRIEAGQLREAVNPDDVHKPVSRLVCLENSSNRGGGSCYALPVIDEISRFCRENQLALHLDGARLFNAIRARNEDPKDYGRRFDSISICLNKGLGCPIGSLILGSHALIRKARRVRKLLGGGMRQAGYMAACGIYALENHIERLDEDHKHARAVAQALAKRTFVEDILPVETNIVIFDVSPDTDTRAFVRRLEEKGIRCIQMAPRRIRMVFHLDISPAMVEHCVATIAAL